MATETQNVEKQGIESSKNRLLNRYAEKYKDSDFSKEGLLEDKILEDLDEFDREKERYGKYREMSDKMTELFATDKRSAALLNAWASGEDPVKFMLENFGDEFKAALDSPEGRDAFVESHNRWLEKQSRDAELARERDANFDRSMETLEAWRVKNNLSEAQAVEVFLKIHRIGADVVDGIYSEESFDMAKKALNYDNDIASAREDGQVAGRNEKIEERLRETAATAAMPPSLGGQGSSAPENPAKERKQNMWAI